MLSPARWTRCRMFWKVCEPACMSCACATERCGKGRVCDGLHCTLRNLNICSENITALRTIDSALNHGMLAVGFARAAHPAAS